MNDRIRTLFDQLNNRLTGSVRIYDHRLMEWAADYLASSDNDGIGTGNKVDEARLAGMIDHTLLKPEATEDEITMLCREADEYGFASVCVNPCFVPFAADLLNDSPVAVCTVAGFPLGASTTATKTLEARGAVTEGALEVDMVLNVGMFKSGHLEYVEQDVTSVVQAVKTHEAGERIPLVKVILETALLTEEEILIASLLSAKSGADFIKTSTGFAKKGAVASDVALMRSIVGSRLGVKAAGGIRSINDARAMITSGATRIGASASVAIVRGLKADSEY